MYRHLFRMCALLAVLAAGAMPLAAQTAAHRDMRYEDVPAASRLQQRMNPWPDFTVTSHTWGRLRADLGAEEEGSIELSNNDTRKITIEYVGPDSPNFTLIDRELALGDLQPKETKTLRVKFHPAAVGLLEHLLVFTPEQGPLSPHYSVLSGTGIYARVAAVEPEYSFGTVQVGQSEIRSKRDIEFRAADDIYAAEIEITELKFVEPDAGPFFCDTEHNLFRDNGTEITQVTSLPIVLQKGEKLILRDVVFNPTKPGSYTRSLIAIAVDDTHLDSAGNSKAIAVLRGIATSVSTEVQNAESSASAVRVYPSISQGEPLQVSYSLPRRADVRVVVSDLLGRAVYTAQAVRIAGEQRERIAVEGWQAGWYTVGLYINGVPSGCSAVLVQ